MSVEALLILTKMSSVRQGDEGQPPNAPPVQPAPKSGVSSLNSHNTFSPMVAFLGVILYVINFVWVSWRRSYS